MVHITNRQFVSVYMTHTRARLGGVETPSPPLIYGWLFTVLSTVLKEDSV